MLLLSGFKYSIGLQNVYESSPQFEHNLIMLMQMVQKKIMNYECSMMNRSSYFIIHNTEFMIRDDNWL